MIANGVTLPEIPAEMLAKYPNALILWNPQEVGSDGYMLYLTKGEIGYLPPSILGTSNPYLMSTDLGFARYMVAYPNNATEWILQGEVENNLMQFELLDTFSPVWANLDIYECTSLDLNTGAYTKGDIWFPNSLAAPSPTRYSIAKAILDGVARQIMRLTDSSVKLAPEDYEPRLETVKKGGGGGFSFTNTANGCIPDYDHGYAVSIINAAYLNFTNSATGTLS